MNYIKGYKVFEGKNIGVLYHLMGIDALKYVFEKNKLTPRRWGGQISFTRDKMLNSYTGDKVLTLFKLEIDADKLNDNYKIKPFVFKSFTDISFYEEKEEVVKGEVKNISKYVNRLIIIKSKIEAYKRPGRDENLPSDFFTNKGTRFGTMPEIIKWVVENSPYPIYVQEGSVIKKDDEYLNSIINYKLKEVNFKYDVWYRGRTPKMFGRIKGFKDTLIDSQGNKHIDWVVGEDHEPMEMKDSIDDINFNLKEKEIDGEIFEPYFVKFRILSNGKYYLEDAKPLDWVYKDLLKESHGGWDEYIHQLDKKKFTEITEEIWDTIQDEGYTEEVNNYKGDFNKSNYSYIELDIPKNDISGLKNFDSNTINKWNEFDIYLKDNGYYPKYIDLINYDGGKVYIVQHNQNIKESVDIDLDHAYELFKSV